MGKRKDPDQIAEDKKARARRRVQQAAFRHRAVLASENIRLQRTAQGAIEDGLSEDEVIQLAEGQIKKAA